MKNFLFLFFAFLFFVSCDDIEDNTPGFQANLEGNFFKANDSKGIRREGNSYTIQGITRNEVLTLKVQSYQEGEYTLGEESSNFAIFEDGTGNLYSTNVHGGSGKITISRKNTGQKYLSGSFNFTAINPNIDTLVVNEGVFYQVPYDFNPVEGEDGENTNIADLLIAVVDGVAFNPFSISATTNATSIHILGSSPNKTLKLRVPIDAQSGSYNIPSSGYTASYALNGVEGTANEGIVFIIDNDMVERRIRGTFSFTTDNNSISQGQFRINY